MHSIHNDPKYYPNPDTFDPERFSTENKAMRPNGTFFPFGDGPRQCIGMYKYIILNCSIQIFSF